ncbi:TIGR00341 family protein [Marinoscillum sp. MHG1-6]|uniref:TIGR00341 family protein n=1 Tax=Marinoscillum sp. MHG1-6 TaxID=2959627 RepID=UPI002157CDDF|nr:TIGR00341 family protein [Marinoscillum sp. MHG1-6]
MSNNNAAARLVIAFRQFMNERFNLHEDKERESTTINEIKKGVEFKGANLWILIFAIFIASIGLNVDSTAVIIGAMLISPLMGPIIGVGLGAGINDFELIKKAFKNLSVAVLASVLTSALYFWITPLHEAQNELLARTEPTLWDVLIAFFGGLAGIVAGSRKEKSNAIPGVAIATALMPPLCTAGYGLANGNWYFFIGAFYLFFINSVLISVATFLIVRALKYPKKKFESPAAERKVKSYILAFVLITIIPSVYLAYGVVRRTLFEQNARHFVSTEVAFEETYVINQEYAIQENKGIINLTLYGKPLTDEEIKELEGRMKNYKLGEAELVIRQGYEEDRSEETKEEFERMSASLKLDILNDLYSQSEEQIKSKDDQIAVLEEELFKLRSKRYPITDISKELSIQYPTLKTISIGDMTNQNQDTVCYAVLSFTRTPYRRDIAKIEEWLTVRTKADSLVVVLK